ncbi:MAG: lipid-binding SYLF domain-containing protein [Ginsengibacter sp.]
MKKSGIISYTLVLLATLFSFTPAKSQDAQKELDKITASTKVLQDFGQMKEKIPHELMDITQGIIVVPKLINAGFVVGGKRGKGVAMVKLADGSWSNPVFVTITGGSVGLQAGLQAVDLVLIFKNRETLQNIDENSFTLGGDVSVTAGPLGRNSTASTDAKLEAEVYSYSRSKGLFAGISLGGSVISIDETANKAFYGSDENAKTIFAETNSTSDQVSQLKQALESLNPAQ